MALLEEKERRNNKVRAAADFQFFAHTHLKIRAKSGALETLTLNEPQLYLQKRLDEQLDKTGKVRALVLKGRQQGASTFIGARFYHKVKHTTGAYCFILTHEQKATDNLFNMVDRYWRKDPNQPKASAANAKELVLTETDSGYAVGTAGAKSVGRSQTMQFFHGSECAFWPNASSHFASVVQAVPDLPGTEIILESTANGIGGEFHERWQMAEAGAGDYQAIFIPWFWSKEYAREVPNGFVPTDEEAEYQRLHGITLEQVVWMRAKRAELKDPMLFMQEYPATAAEAFQTTGHDSFIKTEHVLAARKSDVEGVGPLVVGVDPSRFGDDSFAICWRRGRCIERLERRYKLDAVTGANWIRQVIDEDAPERVFVDAGGIGGPVVDILRSFGGKYEKTTDAVDFGSSPTMPAKYGSDGRQLPGVRNRRAEMWSLMRDWLVDPAGVSIPDDDSLHADMCGPGFKYDLKQKVLLESKEDMRKRGLRSPDGADAAALTFAAPVHIRSEDDARPRYGRSSPRRRSVWAA